MPGCPPASERRHEENLKGSGWGLDRSKRLTMSDSRQDTSCRTHGSRQFKFLFTFWRDVSLRI